MTRAVLSRPRRVAIGDPQAPFERFLDVLRCHELLGAGDRLRDDTALVSIGDHFDWGVASDRARASASSMRVLDWLESHPADQVAILAGNHDLARVGELAPFDDDAFAEAQRQADALREKPDPDAEAAFLDRWPTLPTSESAARDFGTFRAEQRDRVVALLRQGRLCLALPAADDLLLTHAGVTRDDLDALGLDPARQRDARAIAGALNAALDAAVAAWDGRTPRAIGRVHRPGSAASGESRGALVQRPAHPDADESEAAQFHGPPRRRYDPRRLPPGLTQAIGHIRDPKCRKLLGPWTDGEPAQDGPLRHLSVRGGDVRYGRTLPPAADPEAATLVFLDSGMNFIAAAAQYDLFDLDARRALRA
jgi:hypothetical protein